MHKFKVWTADVSQVYLQSSILLNIEICISKRLLEFDIDPQEFMKLFTPPYGICNFINLLHATIDLYHRLDLEMILMTLDPAFYFIAGKGLLNGLCGVYGDDLQRAGKPNFRILANGTREKF